MFKLTAIVLCVMICLPMFASPVDAQTGESDYYTADDFAREFIVVENIIKTTDDGILVNAFSTETETVSMITIRLVGDQKLRSTSDISTNEIYRVVARTDDVYHIEVAIPLIKNHTLIFNDNGYVIGTDGTDTPEGFSADARLPLSDCDFFLLSDNNRGAKKLYVTSEFHEKIRLDDLIIYKTSDNDYVLKAGANTENSVDPETGEKIGLSQLDYALRPLSFVMYSKTVNSYNNNNFLPNDPNPYNYTVLASNLLTGAVEMVTHPLGTLHLASPLTDGAVYEATDGLLCMEAPFSRFSNDLYYNNYPYTYTDGVKAAARYYNTAAGFIQQKKYWFTVGTQVSDRMAYITEKLTALGADSAKILVHNAANNTLTSRTADIEAFNSGENVTAYYAIRTSGEAVVWLVKGGIISSSPSGSGTGGSGTGGSGTGGSGTGGSIESNVDFEFTLTDATVTASSVDQTATLTLTANDIVTFDNIRFKIDCDAPFEFDYAFMISHNSAGVYAEFLELNCENGFVSGTAAEGVYAESSLAYIQCTIPANTSEGSYQVKISDLYLADGDHIWGTPKSVIGHIKVDPTYGTVSGRETDHKVTEIYKGTGYPNGQSIIAWNIPHGFSYHHHAGYLEDNALLYAPTTVTMGNVNIPISVNDNSTTTQTDDRYVFSIPSVTADVTIESTHYAITFSGPDGLTLPSTVSRQTRYSYFPFPVSYDTPIRIADAYYAADPTKKVACTVTPYGYVMLYDADPGDIHVVFEKAEIVTKPTINPDFGNEDISDALKQIGMDTVAKIETHMKAAIREIAETIKEANTALYDVILMYSTDGGQNWIKADKEHFPEDGRLLVTLPVPEGTNPDTHDYTILHMFTTDDFGKTPGTTENPTYTVRQDEHGAYYLDFYVTGLSPITVGWAEKTEETPEENTFDENLYWILLMMLNQRYDITAEATEGGSVILSADEVRFDKSTTVTFIPDEGYTLGSVIVNGKIVEVTDNTITLKNIRKNQKIEVTFEKLPWANPFSDVPADVDYLDALAFVCENGLFNGESATAFNPDGSMTRAMFVTVLGRMAGVGDEFGTGDFADVPADAYYAPYVGWAKFAGITNGDGTGSFGVDDALTVEEAIVFLARYRAHCGYPTEAEAKLADYADAADVSDWAADAMAWAVENGIYAGADGKLNPQANATRAMVAQMLYNFCMAFDSAK